ncbi:C40 family peptidase [Pseudomonas sp. DTU_2021_1001937_2_SI_NGA_ILE_001]|uniref:C40 family peptidase n=1 Tax=Pseudomonas sp. DTU_2021_1001937_2_SI_NGA_ILE_001 TaxID=3077589 RepID=UPI0028FC31F3|nr:C40 family peptidase [Pseudomonas sp. DTU_2021_1001937_2_SI_NGA_ILE_001]WNW12324.1 C40 family peptidase [Pseudomonas sp. DTU_2021_1001937_2_SI_NGA_ILE_001]
MRPFLKTWLTICLLMPLAAHATNREQRLPTGFTGYTARSHASVAQQAPQADTRSTMTAPAQLRKGHVIQNPVAVKNSRKSTEAVAGSSKQGNAVVKRALETVGTPYRWGGNTPGKGLDCSGLVKYAFSDVTNVDLPRTSKDMAAGQGQPVDRKDLKPGDLLFFNIKSRRINHVAIYLGNDRFVHAPRRGKAVTVDSLKKPYWDKNYKVAKRVLPKQKAPLNIAKG